GPGAGGEAFLLLLEEDAPVRGTLAGADAELALRMGEQLLAAAQHAGDVGTDADVMTPAGMRLEHGVEARDLVHLDRRQLEVLSDCVHEIRGEEALVLLLRGAQRRE